MTLSTIRKRLARDERGIALVMALGILTVTAIMVVTIVDYTSSNQRTAYFSKTRVTAFDGADAGMNNALAVLNKPTNNALDKDTLPPCHDPSASQASDATQVQSYFGSTSNFVSRTSWNHNYYGNTTVDWCGDLDRLHSQWYLWSIGYLKNPTSPQSSNVSRTLSAKVSVVPTLTQPNNNPSWNYIYSTHTGSACDQTMNNNVGGGSWMYVMGNLCLGNNVGVTASKLIVNGNLDLANNASVGANTNMSTRVETYVGANCRYGSSAPPWVTCTGNQDANHIYSKLADGATVGVNHTAPIVNAPAADFATWYENAIPGPASSCTTSAGTPPTFDNNYPSRDNSVASVFDLTPATSYTCRVGPGANTTLSSAITSTATTMSVASASGFPATGSYRIRIDDEDMTVTAGAGGTTWTITRGVNSTTAAAHSANAAVYWDNADTSGELSWNASSKTLTVKGTIFIDGSAKVSQNANYNGQATLYLSGTMNFVGSLCGVPTGASCVFSNWNPNTEMLTIVANGSGGQVNASDSIQLQNGQYFQGGLFGTSNVEYGNNASSDGPILGSQIILSNNVTTNAFPNITTVPVGMPGNPNVYAQPNPPQSFSG
jgi:Tfp pilus assembly protein PilX